MNTHRTSEMAFSAASHESKVTEPWLKTKIFRSKTRAYQEHLISISLQKKLLNMIFDVIKRDQTLVKLILAQREPSFQFLFLSRKVLTKTGLFTQPSNNSISKTLFLKKGNQ